MNATARAAELGAEHGQRDAEEWLSIDTAAVGPHSWCEICGSPLLLTDWEDHHPIWAHKEVGCDDPIPNFWPEPDLSGDTDANYGLRVIAEMADLASLPYQNVEDAYEAAYREAVEAVIREGVV